MRLSLATLSAVCVCATLCSTSRAQLVPFFGGNTAFEPEISVVSSGQVLDAQVVVSNDMKYVTITARTSSSQLLALREFTFAGQTDAGPALGFVGDGAGGVGLLARRGMRRVALLDD